MNLGILFILGIGVFGGMLGARLFQKLRIPQVVGYIVMGLILGQSGFKIIGAEQLTLLKPFNLFALGIIGFLVGGELLISVFKKYAKQFTAILLGEGLGAFILVGFLCGTVIYLLSRNLATAVAAGIVFGAIASATDPASTIDVLWEYRSRGVLTSSITAIVALDDALAMTLYGLGTSAAEMITDSKGSLMTEFGKISLELFGSIALGTLFALAGIFLLKWFYQREKTLAISLGLMLMLIWICDFNKMDVILATMTLGFVLANAVPKKSKDLFKVMREFSTPIYTLFFVLIGARLTISNMPLWLWGIVILYVLGRSAGKMGGAWFGAKITGSDNTVRKYLGLGLFCQGGVAVGLSIMAAQGLSKIMIEPGLSLGDCIIFAVTATTLIVQVLGPPLVKLSVKLAGETGRNVTENDVIQQLKAGDAMLVQNKLLKEGMRMSEVMVIFSENDFLVYPVISRDGKIKGTLSINEIKNLLSENESWQWLLAADLMEPLKEEEIVKRSQPLKDAMEYMQSQHIEQLPVVDDDESDKVAGLLDMTNIRKRVHEEILKRQMPQAA